MARILIIDDNAEFRSLMRALLEKAGYEVTEASNGEDGLKKYESSPADLVITDMIMPVKEGLETILELRKIDPSSKIIAVSGDGVEEPKTYLEGAEFIGGATRCFVKPFQLDDMLEAVRELLPEEKDKNNEA